MMKVHKFKDSKKIGDIGEQLMTLYLQDLNFEVYKLSVPEQKEYLYDLRGYRKDKIYGFEVKTELKGEETGNIFYETEVDGKPGWTQKYDKDSKVIICWILPLSKKLYFFPASKLKKIPYTDYPKRKVWNPSYSAEGYKVPITLIKTLAKEVDLSKYSVDSKA